MPVSISFITAWHHEGALTQYLSGQDDSYKSPGAVKSHQDPKKSLGKPWFLVEA